MSVEKIISFASWASDHPSDRFPADRLDSQFDSHANAIEKLEARIDKLLRADGKLNHGLISPDSIPESLFNAIVLRLLEAARQERRAAEQALAEIKFRQEDIWRRLDDAKVFAQEASREFAHNLALVNDVVAIQEDLNARLVPLAEQTAAVADNFSQQGNAVTLSANAAENWAEVSMEWAEHMPDTIPGNILATNAVTGDHWSSRWWAHQAASAVGGFLFHYYLGPFPDPPFSVPGSGSPLQPGMIYFDTDSGQMYVWSGTSWVSFNTPQSAGTTALFYKSAANQTVFPLATLDLLGRSVTLNPAKNEGVEVFVNGVRLTPGSASFTTGDYTVDKAASTVTVATPLSLDSVLAVDVLKDPVDMAAVGVAKAKKLKKFVFDGTASIFALLDNATSLPVPAATDAAQLKINLDGVDQEPGVDFVIVAAGASVQFTSVPAADAKNFGIYFLNS